MNAKRALIAAVGASITVAVLAGCSGQEADGTDMGESEPTSSAAPTETATAFNDQDVMFAQMMAVHHSQAIDMAEAVLAKDGVDPQVTAIAKNVRAAQEPEIELMNSWLEEWGLADATMAPMDGMEGMDGMDGMGMSESEMAALEDASGEEASRLFLEQMTMHHQSAIDMAETQVENGENPDAVALAEKIIADQKAEIEQMQEILATL